MKTTCECAVSTVRYDGVSWICEKCGLSKQVKSEPEIGISIKELAQRLKKPSVESRLSSLEERTEKLEKIIIECMRVEVKGALSAEPKQEWCTCKKPLRSVINGKEWEWDKNCLRCSHYIQPKEDTKELWEKIEGERYVYPDMEYKKGWNDAMDKIITLIK